MAKNTGSASRFFRDDENFNTNKCSLCGDCDAENYIHADGYTICPECAEQMDIQDIMDLFGYDCVSELIEALCGNEV